MKDNRETLSDWLRDAHAMEQQAATVMQTHADRLKHYEQVKALLEANAHESREQAARLEDCLEATGSRPSAFKDLTGKLIGLGQTLSGYFAEDEVVKGMLALYAFKHLEIASYRMLVVAANRVNEQRIADVCAQHLDREIELTDELDAYLEEITETYLDRERIFGAAAAR